MHMSTAAMWCLVVVCVGIYLQVCGTDGVTYNSTCHLRTQSANAQVDYRGMCMEDGEDRSLRDICRRVREAGRCDNNEDTCERRVRSRDSCCPVCGEDVLVHNTVQYYQLLIKDLVLSIWT